MKQSFKKIKFQSIKSFSMMYTLPDGDDGTDFIFMSSFDDSYNLIEFMFDEDRYHFNTQNVLFLVSELIKFFDPKYAYVYQREFKLGPAYYNWGAIMGIPREEGYRYERWKITKWLDHYPERKGYKTGDYRDIYPYNLISSAHLEQEIEGKKLAVWIKSDERNGELTKLSDDLWMWKVDEANIPHVREAMRSTGRVICI